MNKLSKEKRQQLVLVVLITLTVLSGLWYGLIRAQQRGLAGLAERKTGVEKELANVKSTIARADQIETDLEELSTVVALCEEAMASGDIYAWVITKVRNFKTSYKIDLPQYSQIDGPRDVNLLPEFPYKQASLSVAGTGKFHDIGLFIANFENQHPFARLCNLVIEPATSGVGVGDEKERLSFRVDVITLIKPAQTATYAGAL
jgi:Tfp pilus assembly protein PilO